MPTTIDSAGIIFNDATSLTSANIGTAQLVNGSVTAAKLGTNEQKRIAKAWVNFNGSADASISGTYSQSGTTVTVTIAGGHGLSQGQEIYSNITSGTAVDGTYTVVSITSSTVFTYTAGTSLTTSGNITLNRSSIRSSYNVSSVTKNGTGNYTVNFATPMADANYSVSGLGDVGSNTVNVTYLTLDGTNQNFCNIRNAPSGSGSGGGADTSLMCVQIFGN
jgi:hypothetical protein